MPTNIMNSLQQITEQNLADIEQAKTEGRSIIGFYCLYSPTEIAVAAGAVPLPLCGTRNDPIAAAEEVLPRNLCSHTYNVEAYQVDEMVQETFGLPTLHLETDYSESDTEQLRVRIEAYLEML